MSLAINFAQQMQWLIFLLHWGKVLQNAVTMLPMAQRFSLCICFLSDHILSELGLHLIDALIDRIELNENLSTEPPVPVLP